MFDLLFAITAFIGGVGWGKYMNAKARIELLEKQKRDRDIWDARWRDPC